MDYEKSGNWWGKVFLNDFNNGLNQRWQVNEVTGSSTDSRIWEISYKGASNLLLDVRGNNTWNGSKVGLFHRRNGTKAQRWRIVGKQKEHEIKIQIRVDYRLICPYLCLLLLVVRLEPYSHVPKEKQGLKRVRLNFWEEFRKEFQYG